VTNGQDRREGRAESPKPVSEYLMILVRWRRVVVTNALIVAAATAVVSLVVPSWYTATGSILPAETSGAAAGYMSMLETTFPLLSIPGVSTPSEVMLGILESRTVAEQVINENDLVPVYRARNMDAAVKTLDKRTRLEINENGIVRIETEARDPIRAAAMARSFIDALEEYNAEARSTTGRRSREFIESRLEATTVELQDAEDALAAFQREHATIEIGEQARAAIGALADLETRAAVAEIQLGVVRSYASEGHPEVVALESQLRSYREALEAMRTGGEGDGSGPLLAPLNSMPALALEFARLTREVEVTNGIYVFLVQEYEAARIQEARDTPTIQILDRPAPPEIRTRPRRKVMVAIGALVGLILGVAMAFFLEFLSTTDSTNPTRRNLDTAVAALKGDLARFRGRR